MVEVINRIFNCLDGVLTEHKGAVMTGIILHALIHPINSSELEQQFDDIAVIQAYVI